MSELKPAHVYQLKVWLQGISPMVWRRLLVRSDSTIADLHYTIQIAMGWSDVHLNRFHIHGQDFGVYRRDKFRRQPREGALAAATGFACSPSTSTTPGNLTGLPHARGGVQQTYNKPP